MQWQFFFISIALSSNFLLVIAESSDFQNSEFLALYSDSTRDIEDSTVDVTGLTTIYPLENSTRQNMGSSSEADQNEYLYSIHYQTTPIPNINETSNHQMLDQKEEVSYSPMNSDVSSITSETDITDEMTELRMETSGRESTTIPNSYTYEPSDETETEETKEIETNTPPDFRDYKSTSPKNDEDFDMEYERVNENELGDNKNIQEQKSEVHINYGVNIMDSLRLSEFNSEYAKFLSPGIESESLVVSKNEQGDLQDDFQQRESRHTKTGKKSEYNYFETSYLLTSDVEMNREPFDTKGTDPKIAKQLELQDEETNNDTQSLAVYRKEIDRSVYVLPPLTVELGEGTSLLLSANIRHVIYYEVTNNLNSATRVVFSVKDEMRILLDLDKYAVFLGPHETTTVRLAVFPRVGLSSDRITFMAMGSEAVRKEAIVDVDSNYRSDDDYPDVDYTYSSDCTDVLLSKCQHGTWTIKVSARDQDSGLMFLSTIPKGLYFPDGYTSGTKEEVTGYYSDTCCNPDIQIIAVDRMNNRIVKQANAYRAPLSFWAVIAIILVSLIIIIIIIACVIFCVKRCRKNEADSFDLPTYRGGRSRY